MTAKLGHALCAVALVWSGILGAQPVAPASVAFQRAVVPDAAAGPIEIGIWYPTSGTPSASPLGPYMQDVATDGAITGSNRPVVIISHGTGGSLASHYDTAFELAAAGFVVVALTHPGDNTRDQSAVGNHRDLIDRPRHVSRVMEFIAHEWSGRSHIDSTRLGIFGASLGGFTALVAAGGKPDLAATRAHCGRLPAAPECRFVAEHHGDQLSPPPQNIPAPQRTLTIRAVVIAAPALGYMFANGGLADVKAPVQLWRAADDREAPNPTNSDIITRALPRPPDVHTVARAGHFIFLPPCPATLAAAVPMICSDPPGLNRVAIHAEFNSAVVRFFTDQLRRSTRY